MHRDALDDDPKMEQQRAEGGVVVLVPGGDVESSSVDPDGGPTHRLDLVCRLGEEHQVVLRVVRRDAEPVLPRRRSCTSRPFPPPWGGADAWLQRRVTAVLRKKMASLRPARERLSSAS
ncbi:hypothetical protein ZWY2020_014335 [Hordeum vulgare]|nr:hypothetical protein ZWY2020_014335 [Hordeum vulgare]